MDEPNTFLLAICKTCAHSNFFRVDMNECKSELLWDGTKCYNYLSKETQNKVSLPDTNGYIE